MCTWHNPWCGDDAYVLGWGVLLSQEMVGAKLFGFHGWHPCSQNNLFTRGVLGPVRLYVGYFTIRSHTNKLGQKQVLWPKYYYFTYHYLALFCIFGRAHEMVTWFFLPEKKSSHDLFTHPLVRQYTWTGVFFPKAVKGDMAPKMVP